MKPYYQEGPPGKTLTIYHGDCREVLPELGIYDLVLTDPPYGVGIEYDGYEDSERNLREVVLMAFPLIRASGSVILLTPGNGNQYQYPEPDWTLAFITPGAQRHCTWGFSCWQPVLAYGRDPHLRECKGCIADAWVGYRNDTLKEPQDIFNDHPTVKPSRLWRWLLKRGAPRPTDRILDPFLGSGTTLWCAKQLGHEAVGIEQSEKYCEIAAKRLSQGVLF